MKPNAIEKAEADIQETLKLTAGKDFHNIQSCRIVFGDL